MILIWNLRSALHLDLQRFFDQAGDIEAPHSTAFSKARVFLKASAFVDLNDALVNIARNHELPEHRWRGLRLLAMDGSPLRLPKGSPEIVAHFGGTDCRQITLPKSIRLRCVRVELETDEIEVLLANLVDQVKYPAEEFKALYHDRWTVEEWIKTTKCKIEMENWTGRTVHSIYQDFYARVLCQNLAVSLATVSQPAIDLRHAANRHRYKVNVKRAIEVVRDHFVTLIERTSEAWDETMNRVARRLFQAAYVVRDGRSFPRAAPRRLPVAQPYKPIV
ncbi:MAG: hypothetical protein ACI9DF_006047 [Verrucomicrobiales bacterium]